MSDPMTRTEIEDVLSSIRRLVSEEGRPQPQRVPPSSSTATKIASGTRPARRPDAAAPAAGRLVLTPALRVADPASAGAESSVDTLAAEDWQPERAPEGGSEDTAEAWQPEAAPAGVAARDDWQPETEVVPASDAPAGADRSAVSPALEATIAELEAAVAARREEWDPDGSEEPAPGDLTRPVGRGAFAGLDDEEEDAFPAPEPLVRPESAASRDPEASQETGYAWKSTRRDWQSEAEAAVETEAEISGPEAEASWGEESIEIDEEALNDLVRQLIRNELQGALGERITRNVRKLVRAEISRALAARKLD